MTTDKECECIRNAARVIMWASSLEEQALIGQHAGDIRFKEPRKVYPEKKIYTLSEMINRDATELKNDLGEFEQNCIVPNISRVDEGALNFYKEGKNALEKVISSRGENMSAASLAGARINDLVQDMATSKKLIRCD